MVQGRASVDPTQAGPAPSEAVREAVTMVLYVCLVLTAEFVAAGSQATSERLAIEVIWGTAIGLALAHVFAFNLAAKLLVGGRLSPEIRAAAWAQLAAAAALALAVTIPFALFTLRPALRVSAFLVAGLIGVAAYAASRGSGAGRTRSLVDGLIALVIAVVVVSIKVALSTH
jgi:hypothetical protein